MPWHTYIVQCNDSTLYTGITNNLPRRIQQHNSQQTSLYTRGRTPVKLVYKESHPTRSKAAKREAQIKRWSRAKKLALLKIYLEAFCF